eukprot:CAMPEP_0113552544 /NCGR_PEP_ID=MMETSP0015_2-20120614/15125_1 /TAXON_ID=2838 /ORGANISM="Odontella" /LENGTH=382 /DNA_ID=CAMNT_0000453531 /DNA_START=204 /DNA_END=1352 /DNA_ORIENTATION=+ /assembly_acc=CAM_ASM_000160
MVIDDCGPPMPKDLSRLTVVQIKEMLVERGESDLSGKKAVLISRLKALLDQNETDTAITTVEKEVISSEHPAEKSSVEKVDGTTGALTRASIMGLKVADLRKELKKRDLRVSGRKAELQERLAEAEGLSLKESDNACLNKKIESDEKSLSFGGQLESVSVHPVSGANRDKLSPNMERKKCETAELKKELKERDLRVSGCKGELQERLAGANGLPLKELQERLAGANGLPLKESYDVSLMKEIESDMKILSVEGQQESISVHPVSGADCAKLSPNMERKNCETAGTAVVRENKENEINVKTMPFHWKTIAPTDDCETKAMNNRTYFWCQKCKSWNASHNTMQHVKNSKKKTKKNKKAIPLVSLPGGSYMGLPKYVCPDLNNPL